MPARKHLLSELRLLGARSPGTHPTPRSARGAAAGAAVDHKATITGIAKQVGKKGAEDVMAKLAAVGAVRTATFGKYDARKP